MSARDLTLIFPYYENPAMLQAQYGHLAALPADVRGFLRLIVVDDGSPEAPATPPAATLGLGGFALYRIGVDVRWNWLACRNLAMAKAKTKWRLMTDIDHLMPEATARRLIFEKLDEQRVYRFSRVDAPGLTPYKPHPNTWLMTGEMFDRIGGYDERFSGYYGTDGEFRDRVTREAQAIVILPEVMVRVPREHVADASTTRYGRKEPQDRDGVARIRRLIAQSPTPHRLTFPWERLS